MFIRKTLIIVIIVCLNVAVAWLPAQRCKQDGFGSRRKRAVTVLASPTAGSNVNDIANKQNQMLVDKYKNTQFLGVAYEKGDCYGFDCATYKTRFPHSCSFFTYTPSLLSSVHCGHDVSCKLGHSVSTTKSYTSSEGYNWGVTVSTKFKMGEVFEIGGEVSAGGTYSCSFTDSKTKTDDVECSVGNAAGKTLQLFNVQSDMECQFSEVTMVRDGRDFENFTNKATAPYKYFTKEEAQEVKDTAIFNDSHRVFSLINVDKISDRLYEKIMGVFTLYNPYTDLISIGDHSFVYYYKKSSSSVGSRKVIPFSDASGNSVFQYACILT